MKTIYLVKHQHGGFLPNIAFKNPPTEKQLAAMKAWADGIWGSEGFAEMRECQLLDTDELPQFEPLNSGGVGAEPGSGKAIAGQIVGSGVGTVTPP